jgi:hypothetical protein
MIGSHVIAPPERNEHASIAMQKRIRFLAK